MTEEPRIRDLTQQGRELRVIVESSALYEMLLALWALFDENEDYSSYDFGEEWFQDLRARVPQDLWGELADLSADHWSLWVVLVGVVHFAPDPHDVEGVLEWLEKADPTDLRRLLLSHSPSFDPADVEAAAGGDGEAFERLWPVGGEHGSDKWEECCRRLYQLPSEDFGPRVAAALRRFRSEVFADYEKGLAPLLDRDAHAKRSMSVRMTPERLVETATQGISYQAQPGVSGVLLLPSLVVRPWNLVSEHADLQIFGYPASDEQVQLDPDEPPEWLIKTYKALGDERRLRMLRMLAQGDATLGELAEGVGLSKSTIHHHLAQLRAAGLVRITVGGTKEGTTYSYRPDLMPELRKRLDSFLNREEQT